MIVFEGEQREDGPEIWIDCPVCNAENVQARTYNLIQWHGLMRNFTSWVVCPVCRSHLLSKRDVNELPSLPRDELRTVVVEYFPLVNRTLALLSVALGLIPFFGAAIAAIALLLNRRPSAWRRFSRIGFLVSVISAISCGILIAVKGK